MQGLGNGIAWEETASTIAGPPGDPQLEVETGPPAPNRETTCPAAPHLRARRMLRGAESPEPQRVGHHADRRERHRRHLPGASGRSGLQSRPYGSHRLRKERARRACPAALWGIDGCPPPARLLE